MFDLFFFPPFFGRIFVFFFSWKSLQPLTHSLEKFVFFFRHRKKKKQLFYTLTRFWQKIPKNKLLPGKKKRYLCSTPISIKESPFSKIFPLIWVSSIFSKNWTHLQFYNRNSFKNESDQKKRFTKKFKSPSILQKKSL